MSALDAAHKVFVEIGTPLNARQDYRIGCYQGLLPEFERCNATRND